MIGGLKIHNNPDPTTGVEIANIRLGIWCPDCRRIRAPQAHTEIVNTFVFACFNYALHVLTNLQSTCTCLQYLTLDIETSFSLW